MPRSLALLALFLGLAVAVPAQADSWMAPTEQEAVSQDGRYAVISTPKEGWRGVELRLVRREEGTSDQALAKAEGHTPVHIRCLDGGKGFVLFESWGGLGYGIVLAAYDGKGTLRWKRKLSDFFTGAEIQAFMHTVSSIHWYRGLWVDEERQEVVVATHTPSLLRVGLGDGKKRKDEPPYDLLDRVGKGTVEEQLVALDLAVDLAIPAMFDAARKGFGRAGVPLAARLRCAVVMAKLGDRSGGDLVVEAARKGHEKDIRTFAILHLPDVMGAEAVPVLRDALRGPPDEAWGYAQTALAALGEAALPTLIEMLGEKDEGPNYRSAAGDALSRMGEAARPAVPALRAMAKDASEHVANTALNTLVDIVPEEELGPLFVELLEAGTGDDDRLALYFEQLPAREAIPALVGAFERAEKREGANLDWFVDALTKCAGRKVGTTGAAWRQWLDSTENR